MLVATGSTATPGTPAGPATATSTTVAESACASLGGTVGGDQTCRVRSDTGRYTLDFRFPVDYPDQQALTDAVTHERDGFVDWASGLAQSFV